MTDQRAQCRRQLTQGRLVQHFSIHPRQNILTALQHLQRQVEFEPRQPLSLPLAIDAPQFRFALPPFAQSPRRNARLFARQLHIAFMPIKLIKRIDLHFQWVFPHYPKTILSISDVKRREDPHNSPSGL